MGVLIDASVLIEYERGRVDVEALVQDHEEEPFYISVITASELLHGAYRAEDPAIRTRRSAFVEALLDQIPILEVDLATARLHAQIYAAMRSRGEIIGVHDSWLAATCLTHGLRMVTANIREFDCVPGLAVESV